MAENSHNLLRRALAVVIAVVVLGAIIFFVSAGADLINSSVRSKEIDRNPRKPETAKSITARKETVMLVGVTESDEPLGFAFLRSDEASGTVSEITIRPDIIVPVEGEGSKPLRTIYKSDPVLARSCLSKYLGIPAAHWVTLPASSFQDAIQEQDPYQHFAEIDKTNFSRAEFLAYRARLEDLDKKDFFTTALASNPVECDGELYIEPHREDSSAFIMAHWPVSARELTGATTVSVFNGTATSGLGGKVAKVLLENGFQITEIANANRDNHTVTTIQVHEGSEKGASSADIAHIKALLGVGAGAQVESTLDEHDECRIAIYIGNDCKLQGK